MLILKWIQASSVAELDENAAIVDGMLQIQLSYQVQPASYQILLEYHAMQQFLSIPSSFYHFHSSSYCFRSNLLETRAVYCKYRVSSAALLTTLLSLLLGFSPLHQSGQKASIPNQ